MKKLSDLLDFKQDTDTRDNSILYVYTIKDRLNKDSYILLSNYLKDFKAYYSKFKKGFVSKNKIDLDSVIDMSNIKGLEQRQKSDTVEYSKFLKDYATKEQLFDFIKDIWCPKHLKNSWYYGNNSSLEKDLEQFIENTLDNYNRYDFNTIELKYIRHAIIHKSLGYEIDTLRTNGSTLYYKLIYNDLPIIKDLKLINEYYTAMWGYDQTNVDIAQRLNKRLWGLDVFKDLTGYDGYYLVRMKENRFTDKNKVKYFSKDSNYLKTFENDASQTGQYR